MKALLFLALIAAIGLAPGGFGDTLAKFTVSKAAPNVLSQKLTGLKIEDGLLVVDGKV